MHVCACVCCVCARYMHSAASGLIMYTPSFRVLKAPHILLVLFFSMRYLDIKVLTGEQRLREFRIHRAAQYARVRSLPFLFAVLNRKESKQIVWT